MPLQKPNSFTKHTHSLFQATNQMCSGDGQCVDPILQVHNELDQAVEFELYTKDCSSTSQAKYPVRSYDTYGGSPWETVADILPMYGMCSYRNWFEYLEFIDPTDLEKRKNQGACGINAASQNCDPASFNAYLSQWWDTTRPYSDPSMLSLYDTKKFQVQPHPCDKDYQHLASSSTDDNHIMQGCAPDFAAAMNTPATAAATSLVDMQTLRRTVVSPLMGEQQQQSSSYGTYVQTLRRDGYMNMQGRPPFDYSVKSPKRKAGFLSSDSLLNTKGETIFRPCKTVSQCFKDTFTYLGHERTRRVFIDRLAVGNEEAYLRDWEPQDAMKCGIFGVFLKEVGTGQGINTMCPGTSASTHYCCALDMAVAPLNYLFLQAAPGSIQELDAVCNRPDISYTLFSAQTLSSKVTRIGKYYAVPINNVQATIALYTSLLNDILNEFSPPAQTQPTAANYVQVRLLVVMLLTSL